MLRKKGIEIVGISPDSVDSHKKFAAKHSLPFELLSDPGHKTADAYGVWVKKKMYGREYFGIKRTTFIIDEKGIIAHIIPDVNVEDHAGQILTLVG